MTHYLGELGNLIPIRPRPIVDPLTVNHTRPSTLNTTLGEVRVAQYGPKARAFRAWDVTIPDCTPDELAPVLGFINGDYGVGPFWWLPEWAQQTNVFPPSAASLKQPWQGTTAGGPIALPDGGVAGQSLIVSSSSKPATPIDRTGAVMHFPVAAGVPVTAAALLSTKSQDVQIIACDVSGAIVASSSGKTTTDGLARASATIAQIPSNASYVVFRVNGTGRLAYPTLTWTSQPTPYAAGEGCQYAIVTGDVDEDVHIAIDDPYPWGQVASANLEITEVG